MSTVARACLNTNDNDTTPGHISHCLNIKKLKIFTRAHQLVGWPYSVLAISNLPQFDALNCNEVKDNSCRQQIQFNKLYNKCCSETILNAIQCL